MKSGHSLSQCLFFLFLMVSCKQGNQSGPAGMRFTKMEAGQTGILFNNSIQETINENIYYSAYMFNGGGVAIADFNNDGKQDLYFTGNQVADKLYLNKGDFRFEDISESSGISKFKGWKNGVSVVDINADGWMDIYVCRGDHFQDPIENTNLLFINQGDLTFIESAASYGIENNGYAIASVFFDMDNDHDLDLYVTNRPERFNKTFAQFEAEKSVNSPLSRHRLYRNEGNGKFSDISSAAGIHPNFGYGLNVIAGDFNQDGFQDLYVCNDFRWPDFYFVNQKNGTFKESINEFSNHISFSSMGADAGDVNNDGLEDLMVLEMRPEDYKRSKTSMPAMNPAVYDTMSRMNMHVQYMHNTLQLNRGNGFFSDIAQLTGLDKTDWSWSPLMVDFDHDGLRDIYITNGFRRDLNDQDGDKIVDALIQKGEKFNTVEELFSHFPTVKIVNYMFHNEGNLHFKKVMKEWGMDEPSYSNGAAAGDLDNDGDVDLVVNNLDGTPFVYRNDLKGDQHYLRIQCEGPSTNAQGIGAKINLHIKEKVFGAEMRTTRGYLSSSEAFVHFGLGNENSIDQLEIIWPDGRMEKLKNVKVDQVLKLKYKNAKEKFTFNHNIKSLFKEKTMELIQPVFKHQENEFNDYRTQILLPQRMSRLGPFMAVGDVNADGREDFFIGGAKGQAGALYVQSVDGNFSQSSQPALAADQAFEDMAALFFDADGDMDLDLYVVSGGSESPEGNAYQDRLYLNNGKGNFNASKNLPAISSSGSCVVAGDFDGDGDLDLFRAGRLVPNQYPMAPESYILINSGNGNFMNRTQEFAPGLKKAGMITSAVWCDVNGDKKNELVIAGEWMPIQIWEFSNGQFQLASAEKYQLQNTEGWWNKLVAEDIDGDGDVDLLCGNLGENYKFHASQKKPFSVYAMDFDGNKTMDIVLAKFDGDRMVPVRGKQCSSEQMPFISKKFPSFHQYADATLEEIYGDNLKKAMHFQAKEFSSIILMNQGGKFERLPLPVEAQFSAVNGIVTGDFDGDGKQDVLLAGNQFDTEVETTPADASIGLLLLQKSGKFIPQTVLNSGVFLKNNVRDVQKIKVNGQDMILVANNHGNLQVLAKKN
ncbi:MAG: VCBS repeat-containing protein [Saprospiraceae bacterium]